MDGPGQYYLAREEANRERWNNLLSSLINAMWQKKQWENKLAQQKIQNYFNNLRTMAYIRRMNQLTAAGPPQSALKEKYNLLMGIGVPTERATKLAVGIKPKVPLKQRAKEEEELTRARERGKIKEPTEYDKRVIAAQRAFEKKEISRDQFLRVKLGLPTEESYAGPKGASIRNQNVMIIRNAFKTFESMGDFEKSAKDIIKKTGGRPVHESGYLMDMPEKYNVAKLNQADGVATEDDLDTIKKYDDMLRFFNDGLMGRGILKFKDFMKTAAAQDPDLDKNRIQFWYKLYGK